MNHANYGNAQKILVAKITALLMIVRIIAYQIDWYYAKRKRIRIGEE